MGHRISRVVPDVEHQPISLPQAIGFGDLIGQLEHVGEDLCVHRPETGRILDMPTGND